MTHAPRLLITGITQLASTAGAGAAHGASMRDIDVITDAAIAIDDGMISWVGRAGEWTGDGYETMDLQGRAVIPGLIDPHTHLAWAGDRLGDFEARVSGIPYEEILARGGGIRSSMRATAAASVDQLVVLAERRIGDLIASGATTIEIKSGYGFTEEAELASLEAIRALAARSRATIVPTLLIHVPPRDAAERTSYLDMVTTSLIPEAARRGLASAVDIFIEAEAFSVAEAERVFAAARAAQLDVKAHVDQFHAIGGLELAVSRDALSADHLEASGPAQIDAIATSRTVATILPGVTLHLGLRAAPGRALVDAGAAVALATDCNPGSSPLFSTQLAMALSVRINGLTPAEALTAGTANAAAALGLHDRGRLQPGMRGDFAVLATRDWRDVSYQLGGSVVERVFVGGRAT